MRAGLPIIWSCPAHREQALQIADVLQVLQAVLGLDTGCTLITSYPRRYGGGKGAGHAWQLPLGCCDLCERAWNDEDEVFGL